MDIQRNIARLIIIAKAHAHRRLLACKPVCPATPSLAWPVYTGAGWGGGGGGSNTGIYKKAISSLQASFSDLTVLRD